MDAPALAVPPKDRATGRGPLPATGDRTTHHPRVIKIAVSDEVCRVGVCRLVNFGYYAGTMSTTRLMILGLVYWMQPVHGYDVRRELESWHADEWANIAPGSIYHALRKLAEEGLLEEVATERVGARPARTTYRITAKGEAEFTHLLWRYWWEYQPPVDPFLAGFAFLPHMPRVEAVAALRNRARVLRSMVEMREVALATEFLRQFKPAHVAWQFELLIDRLTVEIAWCERIAARLEAGAELFPSQAPQPWPGAPDGLAPARDAPAPEALPTDAPAAEAPAPGAPAGEVPARDVPAPGTALPPVAK
jgi:DNA-binding PadR family transcriptional regulator